MKPRKGRKLPTIKEKNEDRLVLSILINDECDKVIKRMDKLQQILFNELMTSVNLER